MDREIGLRRWDALDVLRGLTIMLMLLNLAPGSWSQNYGFLVHASWQGWSAIDLVAPAFLFCIGAAMPLSFERRSSLGATRADLVGHVVFRGLGLVAIGLFLNLYPTFDFETLRIPGVLQRIGVCYAACAVFVLLTARRQRSGGLALRMPPIALASLLILVSYWALLYFVPVPGHGAPRFDAEWNWASVIDRAVFGVQHLYPHWPIDGKIVFDPEGLLSTWPACFNVLLGTLAGITYSRASGVPPAMAFVGSGVVLVLLAHAVAGVCPIVKNIWTSSFALLSGGFALLALGLLMPLTQRAAISPWVWPTRVFGENPLLAYVLVFLVAPVIDGQWFGSQVSPLSIREGVHSWFEQWLTSPAASLLFGLCGLATVFLMLLICHRRRWILKL
jgi:predicted acyltransferase